MFSISFFQRQIHKYIFNIAKCQYFFYRDLLYGCVRAVSYLVPLKNKVCASCFSGIKYADNTKYILEKLHDTYPELSLIWLMDMRSEYSLPEYVTGVRCFSDWRFLRRFWEYSTARVIVDTHLLDSCFRKKKGQLFIETWHGGLGIKRIENDVEKYVKIRSHERKIRNTVVQADLFISNSEHLTDIYKRAFGRKDNIWKTGYPKNDILVNISDDEKQRIRDKVRTAFSLSKDTILVTYAPTFRDIARTNGEFSMQPYSINSSILDSFCRLFNKDDCHLIIKLHPYVAEYSKMIYQNDPKVHDGTKYPDMQELIIGSDAFISDYSSCIFDAALFGIPCFIFANDFEEYRADRGVYFELDELPFPYSRDNDELKKKIEDYSAVDYRKQWKTFSHKVGLYEPGNSAEKIASYIYDYCKEYSNK